ncbi:MAG: hypothetical protein V4628_13200 [Pseudomonadota bacterium]
MITTRLTSPSVAKTDADATKHSRDNWANEDNAVRIEVLEHNVARLSLLAESLWQVLQEQTGLEPAELNRYLEAVVEQRKIRSEQKLHCVTCNHLSPAAKTACIYCGGKLDGEVEKPLFPV